MNQNAQPITYTTKDIAKQIDKNMSDVIFYLAIFISGDQNELLHKSLQGTYAAHSYNMIMESLQNEIILCYSRLIEDGSKDRLHIVHALNAARQKDNLTLLRSHTLLSSDDSFNTYYKDCCKKLNKIRSNKKDDIIDYRNHFLAHSLSINDPPKLTYETLLNLLEDLIEPVESLLVIMDGEQRDFKELQNITKIYADDFWKRIQNSNFSTDQKPN